MVKSATAAATNAKSDVALQNWIDRLRDQEMPVFGRTARSIMEITENENAAAGELAQVILEDPSMTTRVLRLANSVFYNRSSSGINTINHAVLMLGFNAVQNMSICISLVDSFVQGMARQHVNQQIGRSIHAAVQARSLLDLRGDRNSEEVFVATLLRQLGEIAFWCFADREQGEKLHQLLEQPGMRPERAQRAVLGFRFRDLTAGLAQEWKLSSQLTDTLKHPESLDPRIRSSTLGYLLAEQSERNGWQDETVHQVLEEMAKLVRRPRDKMVTLAHHNVREAIEITSYYGAPAAARMIPEPILQAAVEAHQPPVTSRSEPTATAQSLPPTTTAITTTVSRYPEADSELQQRILSDIDQMIGTRVDFNRLMELALEGIYRGVGMDRTLFALLTPDRNAIHAKYALGSGGRELTGRFQFRRHDKPPNLLFQIVDRNLDVWCDVRRQPVLQPLLPPLIAVLGAIPFFVSSMRIGERSIGLLYADRGVSDRVLDSRAYDGFRQFANGVNRGLVQGQRR